MEIKKSNNKAMLGDLKNDGSTVCVSAPYHSSGKNNYCKYTLVVVPSS